MNIQEKALGPDRVRKIFAVLQSYAKSTEERDACTKLISMLKKDEPRDYDFQVKTLANAIVDGLQYGNWPWTTPSQKEVL